jgi:osmotically-inducible protein OsmY
LEACHESSILNMYDDYRLDRGRQTRHGVVYIDGIFATGLMKTTAEALAMDVTGVKQVIDLAGISK